MTDEERVLGGTSRWALLLGAALAMILRAPVYFSAPSFWAEEGMLYFAVAWERPWREVIAYRAEGYLQVWTKLATTVAATLVGAGVVPLARAPLVTVLFALAAQLLPVAVIAWSRAPFWGGLPRRMAGVAIVLLGAVTDEIWLNTVNSQPWLLLATALLLLEPPEAQGRRAWASTAATALGALATPVTSVLVPLFAWRAWRARTRTAVVQAAVLAACAVLQVGCLWSAMRSGQQLPDRTASDLGEFAAALWMRTLIVPLLGVGAAADAGSLVARAGGVGAVTGALLLVAAGALLVWLARGLRPSERVALVGAYALVTTVTLLTPVGGGAMLLRSPWASSRYVYVPGILVLLMLLGGVRPGAGAVRAVLCALVLVLRLGGGAWDYPMSVRWRPEWPRWPDEVQAWEADPRRPLAIWPPPWRLTLDPARLRAGRTMP